MNHSMATVTELPAPAVNDRIRRVYLDPSRDADFYGGHVWKVEYSPAYSHADRWFTTRQEAVEWSKEQEKLRSDRAIKRNPTPPGGFHLIQDNWDEEFGVPYHFGPGDYIEGKRAGVHAHWTPADGVLFEIEVAPDNYLDLSEAQALYQLLGEVLREVGQA